MKIALVLAVVLVVLVAATVALAVADRLDRRAFEEDTRRARAASSPPPGDVVTEEELAPLPPPVRAFLRDAGVVGHRRVRAARVTHGGRFRPSPKGGWHPIDGEYVLTADPPAFLWYGRLHVAPLVDVVARDSFALGSGRMLVKAFGAVPIVNARGPEMDQAGFDRLAAELTLIPTALLPGPHLRWEHVDDRRSKATLTHGGFTASMLFGYDPATRETAIEMERGHQEGERVVRRTFLARGFGEVKEFGGLRLRSRVQGTWRLPDGDLTYVEFDLREVELD